MPDYPFLDVERIRQTFPVLSREISSGVPLVYLDSAATSQKPAVVIDTMDYYYRHRMDDDDASR